MKALLLFVKLLTNGVAIRVTDRESPGLPRFLDILLRDGGDVVSLMRWPFSPGTFRYSFLLVAETTPGS
jgi:hypothetical protein